MLSYVYHLNFMHWLSVYIYTVCGAFLRSLLLICITEIHGNIYEEGVLHVSE